MEEEFKSKFGNKTTFVNAWDLKEETSIWYNIGCDCGSGEHDTNIMFEYDKSIDILFLNFYKTISYSKEFGHLYYEDDTLVDVIKDKIKVLWKRMKDATKLLFTGYVEMESDFILKDTQHIQDFIDALIEGREYCLNKNPSAVVNDISTTDNEAGC